MLDTRGPYVIVVTEAAQGDFSAAAGELHPDPEVVSFEPDE